MVEKLETKFKLVTNEKKKNKQESADKLLEEAIKIDFTEVRIAQVMLESA